jgi:hypothetical protein
LISDEVQPDSLQSIDGKVAGQKKIITKYGGVPNNIII